jgi:hypothetical protein
LPVRWGRPMQSERDYRVGYGKPPQHTRWRKGQSGNPKGRLRGVRKSGPLVEAFRERVTVIEDGRRRKVTKLEAALRQLANRAARGDLKPTDIITILKQIESSIDASAAADSVTKDVHDARGEIQGILHTVRDRLLQPQPGRTNGVGDGPGSGDGSVGAVD